MNKKITAMVMTILFTISIFGSVYGMDEAQKNNLRIASGDIKVQSTVKESAVKISKDKAIAIAKTLLEDSSTYEINSLSLNPNYPGKGSIWNMNFNKTKNPGGNASIGIDANTGEIRNFNIWEAGNGQQNYVAKLTRAEAMLKAEEYLKNNLKQDIKAFELQKEDTDYMNYYYGGVKQQIVYNFVYLKKINEIPLLSSSINIGVNGTNGKIMNYNNSLDSLTGLKFPKPGKVLLPEAALTKYSDSANVMLQYINLYDPKPYGSSEPKAILAYVPLTYLNMVDANTGAQVNYDGSFITTDLKLYKKLMENPVAMKPDSKLTSKALTEKDAQAKADALKKVFENIIKTKFDQNSNSVSTVYSSVQINTQNYSWNKNSGNSNINLNVGINQDTGHISNLGFSRYLNTYNGGTPQPAVKEKYNWKKAKELALEFIKKIIPEQYGFYIDENVMEPKYDTETLKYLKEYSFNYTRLVNGIRYRDNNINVNIDRETGNITNFYLNWTDLEFSAIEKVIPKEDAIKTYFNDMEAKLNYYLKMNYSKGIPENSGNPILVYTFSNKEFPVNYGLVVDALTGKVIDNSGNEYKASDNKDELSLKDNWAKRSIELLVAQGIMKKGFIDPNSQISRFDTVKMLSVAKGMYNYDGSQVIDSTFKDVPKTSEYFYFIENSVKQKIITDINEEFKGEENITKAEFSKLLINLIGYSDIAKYKDIFKADGMKNINSELTGYVAICNALKILPQTPDKEFDGNDGVTYAEAADSLYKALAYVK